VYRLRESKNASATVRTPWGDSSELRGRRLYPGGGTPRDEVARNQRERLFGAIVAVASEKGFEATTVADVLALSGVSRSAFYEHFADKTECLTAAVSELVVPAVQALAPANGNGPPAEPQKFFETFLGLLSAEPAASRVCFVELHVAGEAGEEVADRAVEALAEAAKRVAERSPDTGTPNEELTRALVGGLRKLIHTRLSRGEEAELAGLAPGLWDWITSVEAPPQPLESPRRQRPSPGPSFEGYTPAERIARAVAAVVAEKGYREMSTDDIAARASISLSTFYANFADKRDAVVGALEMSGAQIMALAVPAARRSGDWRQGVRALYEAICAYFVAEPPMAHLALVGVYAAGPQARGQRDRVIDALAAMLAPGLAENPGTPEVSAEASAATVYSLMREQLRREGPASLPAVVPLATYVTLVGLVGPEEALAVANGKGQRR
jgi:AcrR family transcriptional regulator